MNRITYPRFARLVALILVVLFSISVAQAQTTSFTYQGRLNDSGGAANGSYDFQFALFDAETGGNQVGSAISRSNVSVSNGVFSVALDFGAAFPGDNRFLEIRVQMAGGGGFTILTPRQRITSTPYAIRSLSAASADSATNATNAANANNANNAQQLGGAPASQYVQTTDSRLSNPRDPNAGSSNYIQNTTSLQSANFNISGNGIIGGSVGIGTNNPTNPYGTSKLGVLTSSNDVAIFGNNTSPAGRNGLGVMGKSIGDSGVYGETSASGYNGVFGRNLAPGGTAVRGESANNGANGIGVLGNAIGETGIGVYGIAITSLNGWGIFGAGSKYAAYFQQGTVVVANLGGAGSTALCRNASNEISNCSSSLRYKDQVTAFHSGLELIHRLRPVTFNWKADHQPDLGLVAEEVAAIEPLLVTRNDKGEIEGVKYAQLNVVLINAIKQQQEQLQQQRAEIEQLKQLICAERPAAQACQTLKR